MLLSLLEKTLNFMFACQLHYGGRGPTGVKRAQTAPTALREWKPTKPQTDAPDRAACRNCSVCVRPVLVAGKKQPLCYEGKSKRCVDAPRCRGTKNAPRFTKIHSELDDTHHTNTRCQPCGMCVCVWQNKPNRIRKIPARLVK